VQAGENLRAYLHKSLNDSPALLDALVEHPEALLFAESFILTSNWKSLRLDKACILLPLKAKFLSL
jgi:hypothetical protein